jgi:hypothetical protein
VFAAQFEEPVCVTNDEDDESANTEQHQPKDAENEGDRNHHSQSCQENKDDLLIDAPLHVKFFDKQPPVVDGNA